MNHQLKLILGSSLLLSLLPNSSILHLQSMLHIEYKSNIEHVLIKIVHTEPLGMIFAILSVSCGCDVKSLVAWRLCRDPNPLGRGIWRQNCTSSRLGKVLKWVSNCGCRNATIAGIDRGYTVYKRWKKMRFRYLDGTSGIWLMRSNISGLHFWASSM